MVKLKVQAVTYLGKADLLRREVGCLLFALDGCLLIGLLLLGRLDPVLAAQQSIKAPPRGQR